MPAKWLAKNAGSMSNFVPSVSTIVRDRPLAITIVPVLSLSSIIAFSKLEGVVHLISGSSSPDSWQCMTLTSNSFILFDRLKANP